jgi:O-glycosyl hydrolase
MLNKNSIWLIISFLAQFTCSHLISGSYSTVQVIQTSRSGDKILIKGNYPFVESKHSDLPVISINPDDRYQEILGFGGSFTESAAYVINNLPQSKQNEILEAYFSPEGAGYTLTQKLCLCKCGRRYPISKFFHRRRQARFDSSDQKLHEC